MMPRLLSLLLRRLGLAAALLAAIALTLAWSARAVLLPAWPEPVVEVLVQTAPGQVQRHFRSVREASAGQADLMSRSRPRSLWRVETQEGEVLLGWLSGVEDDEGLRQRPPDWLEHPRLDAPLPEPLELSFDAADGQLLTVSSAQVLRMFRPNALPLQLRTRLFLDRLVERWRWPFTSPAGGQTTPPDQSTAHPSSP